MVGLYLSLHAKVSVVATLLMAFKLPRLNLVWMFAHTANRSTSKVIALSYGSLLELFVGYSAAAHNVNFFKALTHSVSVSL